MADRKDDIRQRLLATFRVEAEEHLQAITAHLLALEREPPEAEARGVLEATFRAMHTLKGAARSVSLTDVEALCQASEALLSGITRGHLTLTRPILSRLQEATDAVARLLAGGADSTTVRDLVVRLEQAGAESTFRKAAPRVAPPVEQAPGREAGAPVAPVVPRLPPADSIRVATAKLDAFLLQAEELLVPKLVAEERVREARALAEALSGHRAASARAGADPEARARELKAAEAQARELLAHLVGDRRTITATVDGLLEEIRRLRMMPAAAVLDAFPKMVRDLAREQGKEVDWVARGTDLEIDRKVLEAMKDPLIHLVRNAVDHGVESPEARVRAGKAPVGRVGVTFASLEEGHRIEIRVEDDGRGIALDRVREAAVRARILTAEAARSLPDDQALELIYRAGLSTNPIITDVSGHGLGLAIVRERVERLEGQLRVESVAGRGTTLRMILPATIATFRGLLVRAEGRAFAFPAASVVRALRIEPGAVRSVEGREALAWNGSALPVATLSRVLELPEGERRPGSERRRPCVVVESGGDRAGLLVDEILGTGEVLVKELRPPLGRVRNVAAAGLLGTGEVVLILRPSDLLASVGLAPQPSAAPVSAEREEGPRTILVVDDSITTRAMEKNLLEAAGYEVRVAVDGIEAWTLLRSEGVDLVVSDVDMPRMDGFELTTRIRADRKLGGLPVILVTALESREDKERGIQVGANAYVVKSSFDQSNLLEIIRRLL